METWSIPLAARRSYPLPKYRVDANPNYRGHRLIEALPDVPTRAEAYKALMHRPPPRAAGYRKLPPNRKLDLVGELQRLFVPTEQHMSAMQDIVALVRDCYSYRDISDPSVQAALYEAARGGGAGLSRRSPSGGGSNGCLLWGVTGSGKTSFVDRLCEYLTTDPIYHQEINGLPCLWPQLPVIRIQCKESLKGTIAALVAQIDEKLGTSNASKLGQRLNRDIHVGQIAQILTIHFIGLLIIEDVHKLKDSESKVLEYFCDLMEDGGFPILLVSTYKFRRTLFSDAALLSKLTARGLFDFQPMSIAPISEQEEGSGGSDEGDEGGSVDDWTPFISASWDLNLFEQPTEMPRDFPRWVHFHTRGVRRIAREMVAAFFVRTIRDTRIVTATLALLDDIAQNELSKYQDALNVLRKKELGQVITESEASEFEHFLLPTYAEEELRTQMAARDLEASARKPTAKAPPTPAKKGKQAPGKDPAAKTVRKAPAAKKAKPSTDQRKPDTAEDVYRDLEKAGRVKRR